MIMSIVNLRKRKSIAQTSSHIPIKSKTTMETPLNVRKERVDEEVTESRNVPSFTASRDTCLPFHLKFDRDSMMKSAPDADKEVMADLHFPFDWASTTESKTKAFFEKLADASLESGNKNLAGMQLSPRLTTMDFGTKAFLRSASHPVTPETAIEERLREVRSLQTSAFLLASVEDKSSGFLLRPDELAEKDQYLITKKTSSTALQVQLPLTRLPSDKQNKDNVILSSNAVTLQQVCDENDFMTPATWPAVMHTPPRLVRKPSTGPNLPSTAFSQDSTHDWATMKAILRDENDDKFTTPPPTFHMTSSDNYFEVTNKECCWMPPPTLYTRTSLAQSNVDTADRNAFEKDWDDKKQPDGVVSSKGMV